jgi:hypothetical protein
MTSESGVVTSTTSGMTSGELRDIQVAVAELGIAASDVKAQKKLH